MLMLFLLLKSRVIEPRCLCSVIVCTAKIKQDATVQYDGHPRIVASFIAM